MVGDFLDVTKVVPNHLLVALVTLRIQMLRHIAWHSHLASIGAKGRLADGAYVINQGALQGLPVISRRVLTVDWYVTVAWLVARRAVLATRVIQRGLLHLDHLALFEVPLGRVHYPRVANHGTGGYLR